MTLLVAQTFFGAFAAAAEGECPGFEGVGALPADQCNYGGVANLINNLSRSVPGVQTNIASPNYAGPGTGVMKVWQTASQMRHWLRQIAEQREQEGRGSNRPMRVLDLGCGLGTFPFVMRTFGYGVHGLAPRDSAWREQQLTWKSLQLGSNLRCASVNPFERIEKFGNERFDIVTALKMQFNTFLDADTLKFRRWGLPEWRFFLHDIAKNHLAEDGIMALQLADDSFSTRQPEEDKTPTPGEAFSTPKDWAATIGGSVTGGYIMMRSQEWRKAVRTVQSSPNDDDNLMFNRARDFRKDVFIPFLPCEGAPRSGPPPAKSHYVEIGTSAGPEILYMKDKSLNVSSFSTPARQLDTMKFLALAQRVDPDLNLASLFPGAPRHGR